MTADKVLTGFARCDHNVYMTNTTFQVGTTYNTGHGRDYVWTFEVISRTAKFITIKDEYGEISRVGVYAYDGEEAALPFGRYSMAPVIRAGRVEVAA